MDYHFDKRIRFTTEREHKGLYDWSLQEINEAGETVGRDWIPWSSSLYFKATKVDYRDSTKLWKREFGSDTAEIDSLETVDRRFISITLSPDERGRRAPSYSMLGTNRTVSRFELQIEMVPDDKPERCLASGYVSYTAEFDFRDETQPDVVFFVWHVHKGRFDQYVDQVVGGKIDNLTFRVSCVEGFYSDWSPSITTDTIRILASGSFHKVEIADDDAPAFDIPRLGPVREAEIYLTRTLTFVEPADDNAEEPYDAGTVEPHRHPEAQPPALRDANAERSVKLLASIRLAAWVAAIALILLIFKAR